jgi:hypothetical protein
MARLDEASRILVQKAESLDIPDELADEAAVEYGRVASWLAAEESDLRLHDLKLFPQGSFRLGTPVRPILHQDEFDIDLVCHLEIEKHKVTQEELKELVGDRLWESDEYRDILKERRRCWTLNFPKRFHLDVLPTIPDAEHPGTGVLLTDLELRHWQFSNPDGYATWFYDRMRPLILEQQQRMAKAAGVNISDIPEWRTRTPLQRAVQVLKRHRDVPFRRAFDDRPVSIIVTTLAARAYQRQPDVATTLLQLASDMPRFIENRQGKWWVENPAHENENFADKWNERPALRDAFLRWLERLRNDVNDLADAASVGDRQLLLEKSLGTGAGATSLQKSSPLVPVADDTSHILPPKWRGLISYTCSVVTTVHTKKGRGPALWELGNRPVHKRAGLKFTATTNAPKSYQIVWQVTNTGSEARKHNGLRGGFEAGQGQYGEVRWEETSYRGTHFVEAFVIKNDVMVARSGLVPVRIAR